MTSISVENIDVSFNIYGANNRSLRHQFLAASTGGRIARDAHKRMSVESLKNISFSLTDGDRLALIGHNGAGKTTLLRVLAGIYEPTKGRIVSDGRIVPLFDIALGMDPEATGYENIYIRGLYLGMSESQIKASTQEIAEFSELGDFLNMPVRTYSLGMQARLAFGVSTCIAPEILLLDEGIGAGDASFIKKANARLNKFIESTSILVLASHSMELVKTFCNKAIVLEHGEICFEGSVEAALKFYEGIS